MDVVGVFMGIEDGIHTVDSGPHELEAQLRGGVDKKA
jgi:hypothetical protein